MIVANILYKMHFLLFYKVYLRAMQLDWLVPKMINGVMKLRMELFHRLTSVVKGVGYLGCRGGQGEKQNHAQASQ